MTRMSERRPRGEAGTTLIEVLIATVLLALLLGGVMFAMRIGLTAYAKTNSRLMDNRRVAGAQKILESELAGLIPVVAPCAGSGGQPGQQGPPIAFFQAQQQTMRMVSGFSLQDGWRGLPQILEFQVIPGEEGGVRLIVNETPYVSPAAAGRMCSGFDRANGVPMPQFLPVQASEKSFVLADNLAYCRFNYEWDSVDPKQPRPPAWSPTALNNMWPMAIRVEMAPMAPNPAILQPLTITSPVHIHLFPDLGYDDKPVVR